MNDTEKRLEITKILTYIYHEWGKAVTKQDIDFWLSQLQGVSRQVAWSAAHELVKRKTFGIPKFQDYWATMLEVAPRKTTYNGRLESTEHILLGGRILPALRKSEQLLLGEK
jgi:hypothetical protein